jgi:hypothetical protein
VAARRALVAVAAFVVAAVAGAIALSRRRPPSRPIPPTDIAPTAVRSIAIIPVLDTADTAGSGATLEIVRDVGSSLRAVEGLRVVSATVAPGVELKELRGLLNVGSILEARRARAGSVHVALRDRDSTLLARAYPGSPVRDTKERIATDAANALRRQLGLPIIEKVPVSAAVDVDPRVARGDSLASRRRFADAEREYVAAIKADPQSSVPRYRYSLLLASQNRVAEALREARRAHELDPLSATIHLSYAQMLARADRPTESAHEMQEVQRIARILKPTPKDRIARARFQNVPKRPRRTRSTPRR